MFLMSEEPIKPHPPVMSIFMSKKLMSYGLGFRDAFAYRLLCIEVRLVFITKIGYLESVINPVLR